MKSTKSLGKFAAFKKKLGNEDYSEDESTERKGKRIKMNSSKGKLREALKRHVKY